MPHPRAVRVEVSHTVDLDLTFSAGVTPPRPPPPCSNHDSPAFSDPGDPGEVDDVRLVLTREQVRTMRSAISPFQDASDDRISEYAWGVLRALGVQAPEEEAFVRRAMDTADDGPDPDEAFERRTDR